MTQLSLLDFRAPPSEPPPAPSASMMWLEPDSAEGRYAAWLMCDGRLVAVVYDTCAADGISDGDTATVVLWQEERVLSREPVAASAARAHAVAEGRRRGLL